MVFCFLSSLPSNIFKRFLRKSSGMDVLCLIWFWAFSKSCPRGLTIHKQIQELVNPWEGLFISCREQVLRLVPRWPSCASPRFPKSCARRRGVHSTTPHASGSSVLRFWFATRVDWLLARSSPRWTKVSGRGPLISRRFAGLSLCSLPYYLKFVCHPSS